jgi:hypothetical protein
MSKNNSFYFASKAQVLDVVPSKHGYEDLLLMLSLVSYCSLQNITTYSVGASALPMRAFIKAKKLTGLALTPME